MGRTERVIFSILIFGGIVWIFTYLLVHFEAEAPESNIRSYGDALWYTLITLSTVGYGDFYPITTGGRIVAMAPVIGSIGILSYIVGNISLSISRYMEKKQIGTFGTDFSDHFVVIGWNDFSRQVASQVLLSGRRIAVVVDNKNDLDLVKETYSQKQVFGLFADYTNYEALERVNIDKSSKVFVNFDDDAQAMIHILNIRKHWPNLHFVVILNSQDLKETFQSIGVTYIVSKNEIASKLVASYLFEPDAAMLTEDLMSNSRLDSEFDITQYRVLTSNPYVGRPYQSAFSDLKEQYNIILLGITKAKQGHKLLKNPEGECTVEPDDHLILMGNGSGQKRIQKVFKVKEGRFNT